MTHREKAEYIAGGGARCPFCLGDKIEAERPEADGPVATSDVTCTDCGREWQDIYTLTDVTYDSPPRRERSEP